jgi:hypothetical protein
LYGLSRQSPPPIERGSGSRRWPCWAARERAGDDHEAKCNESDLLHVLLNLLPNLQLSESQSEI